MRKARADDALFGRLKRLLLRNGSLQMRVVTGSMEPVIRTGSVIQVRPLKQLPAIFDIIVFRHRQKLICHYVVHVNRLRDDVIVTRGLANALEDLPVHADLILGLVVSHRVPLSARGRVVWERVLRRLRGGVL